jgi:hypothetical protein
MFLEPMNWDNHGDIWEIDHIEPVSKGGKLALYKHSTSI